MTEAPSSSLAVNTGSCQHPCSRRVPGVARDTVLTELAFAAGGSSSTAGTRPRVTGLPRDAAEGTGRPELPGCGSNCHACSKHASPTTARGTGQVVTPARLPGTWGHLRARRVRGTTGRGITTSSRPPGRQRLLQRRVYRGLKGHGAAAPNEGASPRSRRPSWGASAGGVGGRRCPHPRAWALCLSAPGTGFPTGGSKPSPNQSWQAGRYLFQIPHNWAVWGEAFFAWDPSGEY